ncbi:Ilt1p [Sporobolomyces salmoneus]|uniref:Ilt1p n=1 Tax=Sporobolomyces salmoneus TaxID=183962 RepID=UPI003180740C
MVNKVAENVTGTIGTVLWCIQLVPQVWMNHKRKTTAGLHVALYTFWLFSGIFLGIYAILENINIPIIVQPHCYGALTAVIFCQMVYFDRKWSLTNSLLLFLAYCIIGGGFEVGMYFAAKPGVDRGILGASIPFGILSDLCLAAGFVPQFWQIWKDREVFGLSYTFLAMDTIGAVFSILSLAFKASLDGVAFAGYLAVIVFEVLIVILALILNPAAKRRRLASEQQLDQHATFQSEATIVDQAASTKPEAGAKEEPKRINPEVIPHEGERV